MPWSLLGILLAVCAIACAVGFYKFVYFLSIGYGFAAALGSVAVLVMYFVNPSATPLWIMLAECALFIAYGARLSGGGFGGSCCLLVDPSAADRIAAAITADYKAAYGDEPTCALIEPSEGAHLV